MPWTCPKCGTPNAEPRTRCGKCRRVRPQDDDDEPVDVEPVNQFPWLGRLINVYRLFGALSFILAIPTAIVTIISIAFERPALNMIVPFAMLLMNGLILFGMAEAGKVLLAIEERTRGL